MQPESSLNDIFRFIQLRPPRPAKEAAGIPLLGDTELAGSLEAASTPDLRAQLAMAALADGTITVREISDLPLGPRIVAAIEALRTQAAATTADLLRRLGDPGKPDEIERARRMLSDTLLASYFATGGFPEDLPPLEDAYRVYHLLHLETEVPPPPEPLDTFLARLLVLPFTVQPVADPLALASSSVANLPVAKLPAASAEAGSLPAIRRAPVLVPLAGAEPPTSPRPQLRPAGVARLLVVKQQIKRYEAAEIAHVENLLAGEKKSRAHRQLERTEDTFLTEREVTTEKEHELTTAERFEINREASRTIKEDQEFSLGLSLSGKYGPSIEFSSNFEMDIKKSNEETAKTASTYARNVTERSLERLSERVLEQRIHKVIRETEETNLHELSNTSSTHRHGTYQFLDKVYEAQVFDYGIRAMFDFMVPEPASFLWFLEQHPDSSSVRLPDPPVRLDQLLASAEEVTEDNYRRLAALWGATDVAAPPLAEQLLTRLLRHGTDDASEKDQPHSSGELELKVPAGYRPRRAWVRCTAFTDERPKIGVTLGDRTQVWDPDPDDPAVFVQLSDGKKLIHSPELVFDLSDFPEPPPPPPARPPEPALIDDKLLFSYLAWETNTYSVEVSLLCNRTVANLAAWQLATYAKLRNAYDARVQEHEQLVEKLRSEAEAKAEKQSSRPFGSPPSENRRTILTELKKHCISIITRQRYDTFDATRDGNPDPEHGFPPFFDFDEAETEGSFIRFFEQAFEWDQMQWVFYPYFWARKQTWLDRFLKEDVDPQFREFLQAGSARVVVPVRQGFDAAVTHFLETGKLWNGRGAPPQINSRLYVSIVDEIRARTGAPQKEEAVGEPWEVRVPTSLLLVRDAAKLPEWERVSPGKWEWRPVEPGPHADALEGVEVK